jgi:hypothetical protein
MAYKYFSQKLLSSNELDLTQVFPEKQEISRINNNVTYTLLDIILFLKDRTDDFKLTDAQYVDLDNAISEIIDRYFKSEGLKNIYKEDDASLEELEEFEQGKLPKEAYELKDGKIKAKPMGKPAPSTKIEKPIVDIVDKHRKNLSMYQSLIDLGDIESSELVEFLNNLEKNKYAYEILDEPEYLEMAKLNEEFINKNKK